MDKVYIPYINIINDLIMSRGNVIFIENLNHFKHLIKNNIK